MGQSHSEEKKEKLSSDVNGGGSQTLVKKKNQRLLQPGSVKFINKSLRPSLTADEVSGIKACWSLVQKSQQETVGKLMFLRLFQENAQVKNTYTTFRDLTHAELTTNLALQAHGKRVVSVVDQAVTNLHDIASIEETFHELGARHVNYSADLNLISLFGRQFINAIHPLVGETWSPELEQAWVNAFRVFEHLIKEGMYMYANQ